MQLSENTVEIPIKILMVDDSPSDRMIFRRFFSQNAAQQYSFTETETSKEALEAIDREKPDCILLDYDLPDSNGAELLETINQKYGDKKIAIVMVSGAANTEIVIQTMHSGAQDFLVKDRATSADMVRAVNNAIEKIRLLREKRLAIEEVARSEEKYRTLFDSIDEGFCVVQMIFDEGGKAVDWNYIETNPAFEKLSGISAREALSGKTITEIVPDIEKQFIENYGKVALTGEAVRFVQNSDALKRWFDIYAFRTGAAQERRVAVVFSNITERKLAEQERERLLASEQEARGAAEESSRLKDEFLATLSHELRTPLSAISGWAKILQSRDLDADDTKKALVTIERNAAAQSQLIEDILDISRIVTGKLRLDVGAVDLEKVISSAVENAQPGAEAKEIRLQSLLDPKAAVISGDANRLQQVIWNLLSNAVKFTPKGGRIQVRLERINSNVEITVADTGIGIEPEFLPFVFDRFRQSDGSMTRRHSGLGLGLSIARQIVELHGGTVSVESGGEGQGSTFRISLPLLPVRIEPASEMIRIHPAAPPLERKISNHLADLSGIHILIVDDEADSRSLLQMILSSSGAQVTAADSAAEAIETIKRERFDIIISDIGMPDEDGFSLIKKVRKLSIEQGGRTPAIALTAYARTEDRIQALNSGFQMHIAKPVDQSELLAIVSNLAAHRN